MWIRDKKKNTKGCFCCPCNILDSVTETIEYMFMFITTPLYIICSCSRCCLCNGWLEFNLLFTHSVQSNSWHTMLNGHLWFLALDIFNFVWVTVLFGFIMYFIANFMIKKFNYATPGRNGNCEQMMMPCRKRWCSSRCCYKLGKLQSLTSSTFLVDVQYRNVDACMTRLRCNRLRTLKKVGTEEQWKAEGAMELSWRIGVQAIYGPKADVVKSWYQSVLDSNWSYSWIYQPNDGSSKAEQPLRGGWWLHSLQVKWLTSNVKDPVFSQKWWVTDLQLSLKMATSFTSCW